MISILGKYAGGLSFGTFSLAIKEKILALEGEKYASIQENKIKRNQISRAPAQKKNSLSC